MCKRFFIVFYLLIGKIHELLVTLLLVRVGLWQCFIFVDSFDILIQCLAVPCGFTGGGLPVGIQIVGRRLREDLVLQAAAAYAAACPQHFARPSIDPATAKEILHELATPGMVMQRN